MVDTSAARVKWIPTTGGCSLITDDDKPVLTVIYGLPRTEALFNLQMMLAQRGIGIMVLTDDEIGDATH